MFDDEQEEAPDPMRFITLGLSAAIVMFILALAAAPAWWALRLAWGWALG